MIYLWEKKVNPDILKYYFKNHTQEYFNEKKEKVKLIFGYKKGDLLRHVPDYY